MDDARVCRKGGTRATGAALCVSLRVLPHDYARWSEALRLTRDGPQGTLMREEEGVPALRQHAALTVLQQRAQWEREDQETRAMKAAT